MNNKLIKCACLPLLAVALAAMPLPSRADEANHAPAPRQTGPKNAALPFKGNVVSVDAAALTFSTTNLTIAITSATIIKKGGQPAVFADIAVGTTVTGSCKKDADGKLNATAVKVVEDKNKAAPAAGK